MTMKVLAVLCVCFALAAAHEDVQQDDKQQDEKAEVLLQNLGYYNPFAFDDSSDLPSAIKAFQKRYDLEVTGEVNAETQKLMNAPRCANPDNFGYFATRGKWQYKSLTYRFMTSATADNKRAIRDAFTAWTRHAPLSFREVTSGTPNFKVHFQRSTGNYANAWAHAYFPTNGRIYINTKHSWYYQKTLEIGTHEIGHALGLQHGKIRGGMMYPYWNRNGDYRMNSDDIAGIQSLYGRNGGTGGGGSCSDGNKSCPKWKYLCGKHDYVIKNCKKTCNKC